MNGVPLSVLPNCGWDFQEWGVGFGTHRAFPGYITVGRGIRVCSDFDGRESCRVCPGVGSLCMSGYPA
jgi:hypothetical protein